VEIHLCRVREEQPQRPRQQQHLCEIRKAVVRAELPEEAQGNGAGQLPALHSGEGEGDERRGTRAEDAHSQHLLLLQRGEMGLHQPGASFHVRDAGDGAGAEECGDRGLGQVR